MRTGSSRSSWATRVHAVVLLAGSLAVAGAAAQASAAETPAKPPNVLLILADDLGFSDLGCYGGEIATPNLDKLARGGLRFTQFYNTTRCWPTRAALLTGYYAQQVRRDTLPGISSGSRGVRPTWAPLLPDVLGPLGFRSYHSGKWHLDGLPLENGFDHSYWQQDEGRNFSPQRHAEDGRPLPPVKSSDGYYSTTAIAEHAIKYLKEHAEHHAGKPFFQYLAFTVPHFPLHAPAEDIARYQGKYRGGWDEVRQARWRRQKEMGLVSGDLPAMERDLGPPYPFPEALKKVGPAEVNRPLPWSELTAEQKEFQATKMAIHAAMVDRMDREIGRVLQQVKGMGAWDNTLVLFLSDNGASAEMMVRDDGHDPKAESGSAATHLCLGPGWSSAANTPFRRHKTWVHEGGICTPLVVHWPRGITARGELRHNVGHVIDVVPTILELAGGKRPETWKGEPVPPPPGKSLVPVLAKDGTVTHNSLWWLHENNRAVRVGDWKIVAAGAGAPWELFDLKTDRCEAHDLAARHPDKVRELEQAWQREFEAIRALATRDLPPETKPAKKKPGGAKKEKK
jgi:arylsulfatase A-like enzyme